MSLTSDHFSELSQLAAPDDLEQEPAPPPDDAKLIEAYGVTAAEIDAMLAEYPHMTRAEAAERIWWRRIVRKPGKRMSAETQERLAHRRRTMTTRRLTP